MNGNLFWPKNLIDVVSAMCWILIHDILVVVKVVFDSAMSEINIFCNRKRGGGQRVMIGTTIRENVYDCGQLL